MEDHKAPDVAELKRLVEEGIRSDPSVDAEIVFAQLRAKYGLPAKRSDQAGP